MSRLSDSQIEKAKEIDLLSYLRIYEPNELVYVGSGFYSTKTNDSMRINDYRWWRNSTGEYGKTALSFLIAVRGMQFIEAVEFLSGERAAEYAYVPKLKPERKRKESEFELPKRNGNCNRAIAYLKGRGISKNIIDYCICNELLYESEKYHNAVFVGKDSTGKARYAAMRGTGKDKFAIDAKGSDKRYSFEVKPTLNSDTLFVYEAAIEVLSSCTLLEQQGKDWKSIHHKSLGGVSAVSKNQRGMNSIPISLKHCLEENESIKNIVLLLNNDKAGIKAAENIIEALKDNYYVKAKFPSPHNDINDLLVAEKSVCEGLAI